ncbi:DUF948 domain-containing protein [Paenibacillus sp. FJAT-26967]|uniref:DUF948 domain-containing protein n=1 Tax=Paenibacillus sp. FJAT-26967 TaxID=1729690 RepID=UPI0008397624|nr:DUF948 domain-containing protein [Paenibacillus sp. FJAT-26967]
MTWIEMSAAGAVIAFSLLVWQTIVTLQALRQSLERMESAVLQSRHRLEETAEQAAALIASARELTEAAAERVKTVQEAFSAVDKVSRTLDEGADAIGKASALLVDSVLQVQQAVHTRQNRIADAAEWGAAGIGLWRRWQSSRSKEHLSGSGAE